MRVLECSSVQRRTPGAPGARVAGVRRGPAAGAAARAGAPPRRIWGLVVPALAAERRVITLDLPGFGRLGSRRRGLRPARGGRQGRPRALAARGVRAPFDLVGHSLGGAVALTHGGAAAAADRAAGPGRAGRVAARDPGAARRAGRRSRGSVRRPPGRLAPLTDLAWGRRLLLAFAADDGSGAHRRPGPDDGAGVGRRPTNRPGAGDDRRRPTCGPLLDRLPAPLGLMWGAHDRAVPRRLADEIQRRRPDAELEVIAHAGHVPMIERPDQFAAALDRLLGRLDKLATRSGRGGRRLR